MHNQGHPNILRFINDIKENKETKCEDIDS